MHHMTKHSFQIALATSVSQSTLQCENSILKFSHLGKCFKTVFRGQKHCLSVERSAKWEENDFKESLRNIY